MGRSLSPGGTLPRQASLVLLAGDGLLPRFWRPCLVGQVGARPGDSRIYFACLFLWPAPAGGAVCFMGRPVSWTGTRLCQHGPAARPGRVARLVGNIIGILRLCGGAPRPTPLG